MHLFVVNLIPNNFYLKSVFFAVFSPKVCLLYNFSKNIRQKLGIHKRQRQAKAWCGILGVSCLIPKNVFQFLQGTACFIHTAHEEGNSSGLPHFDLPTTDGSDCGNHWDMWLDSLRHLHWPRRDCHAVPRFASATSVFPAKHIDISDIMHCRLHSAWASLLYNNLVLII